MREHTQDAGHIDKSVKMDVTILVKTIRNESIRRDLRIASIENNVKERHFT